MAGGFGCLEVDMASWLTIEELGASVGSRMSDVWGWTDPVTGKNYILAGTTESIVFVDATNPLALQIVGTLPTETVASVWRDIKVFDNHAFVVADNSNDHGMQVFDLTRLRQPSDASTIFDADTVYSDIWSAHNVAINEDSGFAYIVGVGNGPNACNGGLHIVDIRTPTQPTFVGCFGADGYTHDAQCVNYSGPDTDFSGSEVCFAANADAVTIVDVTDKAAASMISTVGYPQSGYVHQGWLTEDHRYFLQNDETDEVSFKVNTRTLIWDVTDLDDPELLTVYEGPTAAVDHNLYIRENLAFESNYNAGLRIIDISDIDQPVEIAFFDTYPPDDDAGFQGSWSNYPYYDNGMVAVTSIYHGLFVLLPTVTAVPVQVAEVAASMDAGRVQLEWESTYEIENPGFFIEEVLHTGTIREIGFKDGAGDSNAAIQYSFDVGQLDPGKHRLRLRMETSGGTSYFSDELLVVVPLAGNGFLSSPFPNPVTTTADFTLVVANEQHVDVDLFDSLGRRVTSLFSARAKAGEDIPLRIDGTSLANGTYYVHAVGEDYSSATQIVVAK